jgi:hypothetical protein
VEKQTLAPFGLRMSRTKSGATGQGGDGLKRRTRRACDQCRLKKAKVALPLPAPVARAFDLDFQRCSDLLPV